jgi:hypothetical protein
VLHLILYIYVLTLQKYELLARQPNIWDILHRLVTNGMKSSYDMPLVNGGKRGDGGHIGRSFHAQHATKQISARLSSNAPVLVTHFSFLASHPSAMSLMPQNP